MNHAGVRPLGPRPNLRPKTSGAARRWSNAIGVALAVLSLVPVAARAQDDQIGAREGELVAIEQQIQVIGTTLTGENAERQALIAELEEREREVATLAIAGRELDQKVREQTRVAGELRTRETQEQAALAGQINNLSELLRTAYAMGRADALRMLLNQQNPVQASRVMSYFAYFNRARVRNLRAVEASAQRLTRLAREAETEAGLLQELATRQAESQARLEAARQERALVLKGLEETINTREQRLAGLGRDAENLRLLVAHLRERAQIRAELAVQRDPFAVRQGRLAWPLLEGRIRASFGSRKGDSEQTWDGVILEAREGEEVRAVYDGQVVYADWLLGFGMLLVIDHGDGYLSFYGHNEALLKEAGEWVSADEVVALSGTSGGREAPLLYFAIRRHGEPVDPARWCG